MIMIITVKAIGFYFAYTTFPREKVNCFKSFEINRF